MRARPVRSRRRGRARRLRRGAGHTATVLVAVLVITACGVPATSSPPGPTPTAVESSLPSGPVADTIFTDANVITMDDSRPLAEAVAVAGETILAVGTNDEVAAFRGPATSVVALDGRTLVPGFIDTHQHRIANGPSRLGLETRDLIDAAIAQGYTTIHELYVDAARLQELRDLDEAGVLPLRVNAYLPVNENGPEGRLFDRYWANWQPGQMISPHVRVAGLKVFTDFDNATILLWDQDELSAFLLERHREGWQLAVKTVSVTSLAMILTAFEVARAADPLVVDARARLEHMLFATPQQLEAIEALGLVPVINTNNPGQLVGVPEIDALIARQPAGAYAPWRSVFEAGIPAAGMSGFPTGWVEEPNGAPFGSPIHLVYQAVTRVGNLGVRSPANLLDQALTPEQAMRAHTINAAYAAFEDDAKGSITAGKLADLVVLSADPLAVPAEEINAIETLMTMIGGRMEYCSAGSEAICPESVTGPSRTPASSRPSPSMLAGNLAWRRPATASSALGDSPAADAVDGDPDTIWNSGSGWPAWIEIDLGQATRLSELRLTVAQTPAGVTEHRVWGRVEVGGEMMLLGTLSGVTADYQTLRLNSPGTWPAVRWVHIETTASPSWVAWREIEVTRE